MKPQILACAAAVVLGLTSIVQADTIAYPTAEQPSFLIEVPANWEMTQAEEEGDFFHLDGPTGAVFSFRTIKGSKESLDAAIEASVDAASEKLSDLEFGEPQDWKPDGLTGIYMTGQGKDKDGTPMRIGMAWCALNNGQIVELWFVSEATDAKGMSAAEDIANSLTSP